MERISLVGKTFGRLKVLKLAERKKRKNRKVYDYYYLCKCICGKETIVRKENLQSGATKSCGCYQKEVSAKKLNNINLKHGFSRHDGTKEKLYNVWMAMKDRCYNKNNKMYKYYGERNIKVCDEWKNDYVNFRSWAIKNNYKQGLDLDRIDNNGNYEPDNCRFISHKENLKNRSNAIKIDINGNLFSIEELAEKYNIKKTTIQTRYGRGKRGEQLIEPIKKNYNSYSKISS